MSGRRDDLEVRVELSRSLFALETRVGVLLADMRRSDSLIDRVASSPAAADARDLGFEVSLCPDAIWLRAPRFVDEAEELKLALSHVCRLARRAQRVLPGQRAPRSEREPLAKLAGELDLELEAEERALCG